MQQKDTTGQMTTLSACLAKAKQDGFTADFEFRGGNLCVPGTDKCYSPEQVNIENFYRFEGESDPGDNVILYIIKTSDGTKGTLSDAYGTYADARLSAFMQEVDDIKKRVKTN